MIFKKLKKDDSVKVIAGKDIGKEGKIIGLDSKRGKILVENINLISKAIKRKNEKEQGGITKVEAFIDRSNVLLICPKCKESTRVGFKIGDISKKRVCKKCKAEID